MSLDMSKELEKLNNNLRELSGQLDEINDIQRNMLLELESIQNQLTITNEENVNGTKS